MIFSVRCHAAVMAGKVHKNVMITYDGTHAPSRNAVADSVECSHISVSPFTAETHSTVDYNGIAVIGQPDDIADIHLTLENLSEILMLFTAMTADHSGEDRLYITFYRLG